MGFLAQLGTLAFVEPWILAALALLPAIWWLLRATPPAPRRQSFPAIRLLFGLKPPEETPARTPWWLVLLRLVIAALVILALARPILNPDDAVSEEGLIVLAIDDGWAAAADWDGKRLALDDILAEAERKGASVRLLLTAPAADGTPPALGEVMTAGEARARLQGLQPKPWASDRAAAAAALAALPTEPRARFFWAADGLDDGGGEVFGETLAALGAVTRLDPTAAAKLLRPVESDERALLLTLERAEERGEDLAVAVALRDDGREIGRLPLAFAEGETTASGRLELPLELRNAAGRIVLEGQATAGGVLLLDERARRRPVGLVDDSGAGSSQPLLSELYYVERALAPFAEISRAPLAELLQRPLAVIVLPDHGALAESDLAALEAFVANGGLLLRFAGPKLGANPDTLLPVALRGGDRTLGGVMTWDRPARIAPFEGASPYVGLAIPQDVVVNRQVLAEPALDLSDKTWARLSDGTPLVTAEPRGKGLLVLFHTTANTAWSNLALSGLFVELLTRTVETASGVTAVGEGEALPPFELLDGFGRLGEPAPSVLPLTGIELAAGAVGPAHPPGFYGSQSGRRAFNLEQAVDALSPLPTVTGVAERGYQRSAEQDLKAPLLVAALLLALLDLVIGLWLRGLLPGRRAASGAAGLALALLLALDGGAARAQSDDAFALLATLETRLAFVETGDATVDEISRAGLAGLSRILNRRTSVEPAEPLGVDLERDEVVFFPLLYWPVTEGQPALSEAARRKVNAFLATGGTILFDLRDPTGGSGISSATESLQRLAEGLDIPPLAPLPAEHVLTKAFYLMQEFPGRYAGGQLWVDASDSAANDGVATVLIGTNDWAAAWAVDDGGRPLYAVVPEGERQRELAYRFGVNVVMYALTGNYKSDQVHVPFILERLGQ